MMKKLVELPFLFRVVAVLETIYAAFAILTPPDSVFALTGWVLSADGLWIVKLLGFALLSQAWVAWTLRDAPHVGVARALALYQVGSATADWVMWLLLADRGVFSTLTGRIGVIASIPTHYAVGVLLLVAIAASSRAAANRGSVIHGATVRA
jgi:hypothetical protein